jgi:ABC-type oligopeptide transport system substrate-binding subunit
VALPGSNIQVNSYWATRAIVFNIRKGPASDSRVRRAILYSLDRSKLPALLKNGERAATGLIPPGLPGHRELPLVTQDHTRAASERVRLPSASPLTLKLILRSDEISKQVGTWVASGLSGIGIQPLSGSAYLKAWESGDFDAALHLWAFDIAFPADVLRAFETGSARNRGGWTHVGYDALLGQTERGQPLADPRNLLDEMTRILEVQDAAVIPLGYPTQAFLLGKRVMNFATTPFGDPDLLKIKLKAVR